MSKKKELAKNTIIILVGKFCTQFLSFFLLPLYTAYLSSKEYGTVDLITTYVSLIVPIITLQVEMGIFRELIDSRNNENYTKKIISSGIFTIFIQFLLCLIIYIVINLLINIPFSLYIVFNIFAIMLSNVLLQIARGFGDNLSYSIGSTIAGVTTVLFNIFFIVILKWNIEGMLLSAFFANLMAAIFLFFKLKLYKYFSYSYINNKILKRIIKYSLPLVPNGLIWWVINVSDRTIITIFLGASANGIYAISNKFSSILIQIYNVFNLSWTESASLHVNDKDRDSFFSDTFNTILKLFSSICLMLIALLPIVFYWLINKSYNESYMYIPILLLGMIFNIIVSFIGCIYVAKKMTKQVAMTSFWSGIINILINLILIKPIGIYAAAISTVVAFAIMAIYRIKDVKKYVKLKVNIKLVFSLIILFIIECLIYYIKILPLSIINCIILIVILIILNKEFILAILSQIQKIIPTRKKIIKEGVKMYRFKKKKVTKLNIITIIDIILLAVLLFLIFNVNILPTKYLILVIILLLVINILGIILVNLKKKILKIIGIIILILSVLLSGVGSYYLFYTNNFLNESFNSVKKTVSTYYIVTSKDNKYSKKSDIKNKVYYYKDSANIKNVLKVVKEDLKVKTSSYDNVTSMIKDVINKKIDFMLIDKSSYNIVLNLDGNMNKKDLKIVYKFDIEQKIKSEKKVKTAFNIYIRGIDTDGLSDYNAIATVNMNTHEVLLTSIPRDYYMEIAGQNGKKDSLSHMFIYADGTSQKSLENFFDITLDYNIDVQPETLVDLVDKIGGITFCVDQDFKGYIIPVNDTDKTESGGLYFKKGCHELNGMETYAVAHERNSFVGRDRMRQKNCQKIIIAIFEKLKSTNLFANYQEILDSLGNLYTTDIPKDVITDIAKDTIDGAEWNFITQSVDGSDKWDADIAILNDKGYAMIPNTQDVVKATNKINEILEKK